MRILSSIAFVFIVAAPPLAAQRGGPPTRDTTTRQTPQGMVLDFKDQDIAVVLGAIAEAGGINVSLQGLPSVRVTLRMQQQMTREAALEALIAVAEGNNITVTETANMVVLVGPPPAARPQTLSPQQQMLQAQQQRVLLVNIVRLKHATATVVAPLLMSVLSGTSIAGAAGGRGNIPVIGGIQTIQQGGRGGAADGGRGGRGGGGGGGGGGAGGNQGGRGGAAAAAQQGLIAQALGQAFGVSLGGASVGSLAFSDMRIGADEATNSLIIRSTAEDFQAVQQLVQSIDMRPLQVLIEVTIAQVERNNDLNVGVSGTQTRTRGTGAAATVDTQFHLPTAATARDFVALLTGGKGSVNYDVAINALQTRGDVKVLALPVLIAQNNRQAVLNVGSQVPFVQVSQTTGLDPTGRVQTIQYLPVGKQLTITPTINTDGYVNLAVTQTNDDVTNNILFDAPIINTRQAQTQVFVRDGQTTVIGGMSDNSQDRTRSGIPFLSRIPLIGWAFGNTRRADKVSEMYLFLTPHIVSSDQDIDRLRESVRSGSELLQSVPIQGRVNPGGDTINIGVRRDTSRVRRDTVRRDTLIRRPPPDTLSR